MAVTFMPVKISGLDAASSFSDLDSFAVVQAGVTKEGTIRQLADYVGQFASRTVTLIINVVASDSVTLNAGAFVSAIVITGTTGTVKVGTAAAGGQVIDDSIVTGTPLIYQAVGLFSVAPQVLYFTGTFKIRLLIWNIGE
jgi:hypothetical protein